MNGLKMLSAGLLALGLAGIPGENPKVEESGIRSLAGRLIEENGLAEKVQPVLDEFQQENRRYRPPCRLERVSSILEDPFTLETVAMELRDKIEGAAVREGIAALPKILLFASSVIDAPLDGLPEAPAFEETSFPEDHLLHIEKVLDEAARLRKEALSALTDEERLLAFESIPEILDKFIHHIYLETDADDDQIRRFKAGLKALEKVDLAGMAAAAAVLSRLSHPEYLQQAKKGLGRIREVDAKEARAAGFSGDVQVFRQTRHGPVVIGGRRSTRYEGKAAFILDLGGNDTYSFAAATLDAERALSVVVDLVGRDKYITSERGALAASQLGVSLLFDLAGDDTYEGTRMAQGFGGGGLAILWDEKGDDRYRGEEYAQGGGFFGLGLMADLEGEDTYDAWLYSQGFGLTRGLGICLDGEGDDAFIATGKYPCTYGMEGVFQAASQGHGTGLRRYTNTSAPVYGGGIGALLDGGGDDRYDAGNFSQGCGYFFGCGILADRSGNDVMIGSRYTQGTGAHQAAGIVINDQGDDLYTATVAANQAGTWDVTAGMFLDFEGDDVYKAQGLAQAGTAQTAFALLFDGEGNDTYEAGNGSCQGGTGSYEYHDKPSLSIFLDVGGGKDSYNRPGRENGKILLEEWYSVFADFREKTVGRILEEPEGKLKGTWGAKKK